MSAFVHVCWSHLVATLMNCLVYINTIYIYNIIKYTYMCAPLFLSVLYVCTFVLTGLRLIGPGNTWKAQETFSEAETCREPRRDCLFMESPLHGSPQRDASQCNCYDGYIGYIQRRRRRRPGGQSLG